MIKWKWFNSDHAHYVEDNIVACFVVIDGIMHTSAIIKTPYGDVIIKKEWKPSYSRTTVRNWFNKIIAEYTNTEYRWNFVD